MAKQTRHSATGRIISTSTKVSAGKVYVPTKLRPHVSTVKTSSGTKLAKKPN